MPSEAEIEAGRVSLAENSGCGESPEYRSYLCSRLPHKCECERLVKAILRAAEAVREKGRGSAE